MRLKHRNKTSSLGALHKSVLKNLNRILIFSVFYFNDKYFSQALYFRCHLLTWQGVVCGHFSSAQKKSTGWHQRWAKLFRTVHIFSSHWSLLTSSHQKYRPSPRAYHRINIHLVFGILPKSLDANSDYASLSKSVIQKPMQSFFLDNTLKQVAFFFLILQLCFKFSIFFYQHVHQAS